MITQTTYQKTIVDGEEVMVEIDSEEIVVSSITNWDKYGKELGKDVKFIKNEINKLRIETGYSNLSISEKIIANKYFASGVEYVNSEVSESEQDYYFDNFYKQEMDLSRLKRDLSLSKYFVRKIYTGIVSQSVIDRLIEDSRLIRINWLRDGTAGIGYGDTIDGVINFVKNDGEFSPLAIIGVDTVTKTFSVAGDKTEEFYADKIIRIHSSTGNDNGYTVVSSSCDTTNTHIVVVEEIPSATIDGNIYIRGLLWYEGLTLTMQDELFDIYWNGIY